MEKRYFDACPHCGSMVKNRSIYQCRKCGSYYCYEFGWISESGCGRSGECPDCKAKVSEKGQKNRLAGYIR